MQMIGRGRVRVDPRKTALIAADQVVVAPVVSVRPPHTHTQIETDCSSIVILHKGCGREAAFTVLGVHSASQSRVTTPAIGSRVTPRQEVKLNGPSSSHEEPNT